MQVLKIWSGIWFCLDRVVVMADPTFHFVNFLTALPATVGHSFVIPDLGNAVIFVDGNVFGLGRGGPRTRSLRERQIAASLTNERECRSAQNEQRHCHTLAVRKDHRAI